MDLRNFIDQLLVVIVLFKTRPEESVAFTSLQLAFEVLQGSPEIFIYDNSPRPSFAAGNSIAYIHDPANSGVSRAYNAAAMHAETNSKEWLLLFDQDTHVNAELFEKFRYDVDRHPGSVVFVPHMIDAKGLVSPFRFASARGRRITTSEEELPLEKYRFINSGLLVRRSAYQNAGGYDERIPLDFSDIAFGERLKKITSHFNVVDVPLRHRFSNEDNVAVEDAVARFHYFCKGALQMGRSSGRFYLYLLRAFLRAGRLTLRYKDLRFVYLFFQRTFND